MGAPDLGRARSVRVGISGGHSPPFTPWRSRNCICSAIPAVEPHSILLADDSDDVEHLDAEGSRN
jgi:hypothetical protein